MRYAESPRKLQQQENAGPHPGTIRFLVAGEYFHLNDFSDAAEYYKPARELDPNNPVGELHLGEGRGVREYLFLLLFPCFYSP